MQPRVLVADDSAFVRLTVARALERAGVEVAGFAKNGEQAVERTLELEPDVVVMDLQMPGVNGAEAVRRICNERPTPVVVFAAMSAEGSELAVEALAAGAVDILPKPGRERLTGDLAARIWAIAAPERSARPERPDRARRRALRRPRIHLVAASTGGPPRVQDLLADLPEDFPVPVVIAQHMPAGFTKAFAERLDRRLAVHVFEAADGDHVGPGDACILPGGAVSTVHAPEGRRPATPGFRVAVRRDVRLPGARPNASALFLSALGAVRSETCATVLTGMGSDGAEVAPALVSMGATVIAQDPSEALVASMPNAAITGGAQFVERAEDIPGRWFDLTLRPEGVRA